MPLVVYPRGRPYTPPGFDEDDRPPVFFLLPIPEDAQAEVADVFGKLMGARKEDGAVEESDVQPELLRFVHKTCKRILVGWGNVTDDRGETVPFERERIDELWGMLEFSLQMQLFVEAATRMAMTPADRKNSARGSGSGPASSSASTAPGAPSPDPAANDTGRREAATKK